MCRAGLARSLSALRRGHARSERVRVDLERARVRHAVEEVAQQQRRHLDVGVCRAAPLAPGVAEDGEVEGGDHRALALDVDAADVAAVADVVLAPDAMFSTDPSRDARCDLATALVEGLDKATLEPLAKGLVNALVEPCLRGGELFQMPRSLQLFQRVAVPRDDQDTSRYNRRQFRLVSPHKQKNT